MNIATDRRGSVALQFEVHGVDATTGRDVDPLIVEADDEAAATSRARQQGVRPTSVGPYTPPPRKRPSKPRPRTRSSIPVVLLVAGVICFLALWARAANNVQVDNHREIVSARGIGSTTSDEERQRRAIGTLGIVVCGTILIVGAAITQAINQSARPHD